MATDVGRKLWETAVNRNLGECRRLLESGVPANSVGGWFEQTALAVASSLGDLEIVALLLEHGAIVDVVDKRCWSPLLGAAWFGRSAVVALLLEHGAVEHRALFNAARNRHVACVQALLAAMLRKSVLV